MEEFEFQSAVMFGIGITAFAAAFVGAPDRGARAFGIMGALLAGLFTLTIAVEQIVTWTAAH